MKPPNPSGLCMCGCGQKTSVATKTQTKAGRLKDHPVRYCIGHATRLSGVDYVVDSRMECWDWQRGRTAAGYGILRVDGQMQYAHRFFYEEEHGPIPEGMQIDHLCRNRHCVNPDHLEAVTPAENSRRGRKAKLTVDQVAFVKACDFSAAELAEKYGVTRACIWEVRNGKNWSDVEPAEIAV